MSQNNNHPMQDFVAPLMSNYNNRVGDDEFLTEEDDFTAESEEEGRGNISDSALLDVKNQRTRIYQRRHKRHARFQHQSIQVGNRMINKSRRLYGVCISRNIDGDKLANTLKLKHGRYRHWRKLIYEGDFVHLYTQSFEKIHISKTTPGMKMNSTTKSNNNNNNNNNNNSNNTSINDNNNKSKNTLESPTNRAQGALEEEEEGEEENEQIFRQEKEKHIFIFPFGCIVLWNLTPKEEKIVVETALESDSNQSLEEKQQEEDDMTYSYANNIDATTIPRSLPKKTKVESDEIILMTYELGEKMAISLAFAQSVKLSLHEETIDEKIELYKKYPEILSQTGKIHLSQTDIAKKIGELFIVKNRINLYSDMLDTPDVFWEEDEFEPTYKKVRKYLDMDKRIEVMNQRMDIIRELLELLSTQQDQTHANRLEFIIMVLIVIEVVIEVVWNILLKDILGVFPLNKNQPSGNDNPFRL